MKANTLNLKTILGIENLEQFKFHAARNNGDDEPLDVFLRDREEWDSWNSWQGKKNEFNRDYVVSFMKFYPEEETWLFGGIYKILNRGPKKNSHSYKIELLHKGHELIGRLKIKATISRGRSFNLKNLHDRIQISEILKECYSGEPFNGYENVSLEFPMLETIIGNERMDWKSALQNVKGVYVIVDKKTGKKYVGSASGETGIWARWSDYIQTGHGWNKELIDLVKGDDKNYAHDNFRITLIECWPFKTDDSAIIRRENFWKEALLTRGKHGYNKN